MGNTFVVRLKKRRANFSNLIVLIMLVAILGYLGYRIVPVYMAQEAFQEDLLHLAGRAVLDYQDNRTLAEQVVQLGQARRFSIQEENVRIQRIPENPEGSWYCGGLYENHRVSRRLHLRVSSTF